MERRGFLQLLGLAGAVAAVSPRIEALEAEIEERRPWNTLKYGEYMEFSVSAPIGFNKED